MFPGIANLFRSAVAERASAASMTPHLPCRCSADPAFGAATRDPYSQAGQVEGHVRALLVDPSLFTAPYDAALTEGLATSGVTAIWATRGLRPEEACEIPRESMATIFYPGLEASAKRAGFGAQILKGGSHLASNWRLSRLGAEKEFDIVHFQWLLLPMADLAAIRSLRRRKPVVLTVHDTTPFNGNPTSRLQVLGFKAALQAVDHVVVHTRKGRDLLAARGIPRDRISVIPHGPLPIKVDHDAAHQGRTRDSRWTFVLFGRLQEYKGLDVIVEALAMLEPGTRAGMRVIVAGEPFLGIEALQRRALDLGVADTIEWRPRRLTEIEMAALFDEADTFLFPYRRIEASGVYYMVKGTGKWIIASDLGAFSEEVSEEDGCLIPPADAMALASAMTDAVGKTPRQHGSSVSSWNEIGTKLGTLYRRLLADRVDPERSWSR